MKQSALQRRTPLTAKPESVQAFQNRARVNSKPKRRPVSPASPEQRDACRGALCAGCGATGPVDPAHLVPRSLGGCDDALCCLPLCRQCHVGLDRREGPQKDIDLAAVLALPEFAAHRAHMVSHRDWSFPRCLERLTGQRWASYSHESEGVGCA